jgi:uncharacterized protein YjiK
VQPFKAEKIVANKPLVTYLAVHDISVPEPSGLTLSADKTSLWTVSDQTGLIYNISLTGQLIRTLPFKGKDLEGITLVPSGNYFLVVEEGSREIVKISYNGSEAGRYPINLTKNEYNSGLEGISIDHDSNVYILNEKKPALWLMLDNDFSVEKSIEPSVSLDLSGMDYDQKNNIFWIVSDKSKMLLKWSPDKGLQGHFSLPYTKAEGIAVDNEKSLVYIVSDKLEKLFVYQIN